MCGVVAVHSDFASSGSNKRTLEEVFIPGSPDRAAKVLKHTHEDDAAVCPNALMNAWLQLREL